jgi:hypothetical protein
MKQATEITQLDITTAIQDAEEIVRLCDKQLSRRAINIAAYDVYLLAKTAINLYKTIAVAHDELSFRGNTADPCVQTTRQILFDGFLGIVTPE